MDIRQLDALLAIAEHKTFSKAARSLHTVQSNVSKHVARLEQELGTRLVDRDAATLTEEGEAVVARARRIRAETDAIPLDMAAMRNDISGVTRLGTIDSTARWLIPKLLPALEAQYPNVRLEVLTATTTSLLPQVVRGHLHTAVVNLPIGDPDICSKELFAEDRLLIAPPDHPLATKSAVTPTELSCYDLLLPPAGTTFRDEIDSELKNQGVMLTTRVEIDGMRMIATLVQTGFGAAILPATAAPDSNGPCRRIPITGLLQRSVGMIFSRRIAPSAVTRAVHEVITEVVTTHGYEQPGVYPS
ncbi:MAG: LysR family transcriptional regulator [Acidimicrobiia bacterium]|nr:LysR family transcriptional regulator [Acidimicrobiia bacterium]MYC58148.1 LysR family transcriptional regulator [Acidimicrobiia bacterium]MYG94365.1 LysR family transcriptional regulator [Acidimicrobiia bacterium]MYI30580.1 LysR family transcriptional regulator [Acidimicrobiia bacterium]